MHGAIIQPGARIGNNCIINTNSVIEHDVVVEDNCHISTKAIINGNSVIKKKLIYWQRMYNSEQYFY